MAWSLYRAPPRRADSSGVSCSSVLMLRHVRHQRDDQPCLIYLHVISLVVSHLQLLLEVAQEGERGAGGQEEVEAELEVGRGQRRGVVREHPEPGGISTSLWKRLRRQCDHPARRNAPRGLADLRQQVDLEVRGERVRQPHLWRGTSC